MEEFKLPILYSKNACELDDHILTSLELSHQTNANDGVDAQQSIYHAVFPKNLSYDTPLINDVSRIYTTDVKYLSDTQRLLKYVSHKKNNIIYNEAPSEAVCAIRDNNMLQEWEGLEMDVFCDKYSFISWDHAKFVNVNSTFLQAISLYNIASPVLSLSAPLFLLLMPFIVINMRGMHITVAEYMSVLTSIASNYAIVKLFNTYSTASATEMLWMVASVGLFIFSVYQNILSCVKFRNNIRLIRGQLCTMESYLSDSIARMREHLEDISTYSTYATFSRDLLVHINVLESLYREISDISIEKTDTSLARVDIFRIGITMATFYKIYNDSATRWSLKYSYHFNCYISIISEMASHVREHRVGRAVFSKHSRGPVFSNMFYPKFIVPEAGTSVVKNTVNLNKYRNIVISGPNASGKTTMLKSTFINILLAQQFGYGCFEKLSFRPFDNLYCYINIPDTSGRDSLFQAEARRCKNILDSIESSPRSRHFCIFDELYSGTNPEEASASALAFIKYISQFDAVHSMISTHYMNMCSKLDNVSCTQNFNMETIEASHGALTYKYKLKKGISTVKGGARILSALNYPAKILSELD